MEQILIPISLPPLLYPIPRVAKVPCQGAEQIENNKCLNIFMKSNK